MNSTALLRTVIEDALPCRVSLDEQRYDRSFVEAPTVDEVAVIKSTISGDTYGNLICEALGESSQADIDAIRKAFNTDDDLALGRTLKSILTDYARQVAQANGNL